MPDPKAPTGPLVVNADDTEEVAFETGAHWRSFDKHLTSGMRERGGRLGMVLTRVPPGASAVPFHTHAREDEVFYVLSGRGVLRYGTGIREIGPGDCISCPAGTGIAHQIANPHREDLTYLAIGPHDPDEVCTYPDSGKVMVRSLGQVGRLETADYLDGEPDEPAIFALARRMEGKDGSP